MWTMHTEIVMLCRYCRPSRNFISKTAHRCIEAIYLMSYLIGKELFFWRRNPTYSPKCLHVNNVYTIQCNAMQCDRIFHGYTFKSYILSPYLHNVKLVGEIISTDCNLLYLNRLSCWRVHPRTLTWRDANSQNKKFQFWTISIYFYI